MNNLEFQVIFKINYVGIYVYTRYSIYVRVAVYITWFMCFFSFCSVAIYFTIILFSAGLIGK